MIINKLKQIEKEINVMRNEVKLLNNKNANTQKTLKEIRNSLNEESFKYNKLMKNIDSLQKDELQKKGIEMNKISNENVTK